MTRNLRYKPQSGAIERLTFCSALFSSRALSAPFGQECVVLAGPQCDVPLVRPSGLVVRAMQVDGASGPFGLQFGGLLLREVGCAPLGDPLQLVDLLPARAPRPLRQGTQAISTSGASKIQEGIVASTTYVRATALVQQGRKRTRAVIQLHVPAGGARSLAQNKSRTNEFRSQWGWRTRRTRRV